MQIIAWNENVSYTAAVNKRQTMTITLLPLMARTKYQQQQMIGKYLQWSNDPNKVSMLVDIFCQFFKSHIDGPDLSWIVLETSFKVVYSHIFCDRCKHWVMNLEVQARLTNRVMLVSNSSVFGMPGLRRTAWNQLWVDFCIIHSGHLSKLAGGIHESDSGLQFSIVAEVRILSL